MILDFGLKIKSLSEQGSFEGYAATYNEKDLQGDVILKGAFAQAIHSQGDGFPLLWSHKQDAPIGLAKIQDTPTALAVRGELDLEDAEGRAAYRRLQRKIIRGISIGYTVPEGKDEFKNGARFLKEVHLHELSLVSVPAQQHALVTDVKSLSDFQGLLHKLDVSAVGPEVLKELKQISLAIKQLLDRDGAEARDAGLLKELRQLAAELR